MLNSLLTASFALFIFIYFYLYFFVEVIGNLADKPDGKARSRWKNESEEQKRSDELHQRVIATSQDKQDELIQELEKIKTIVKQILIDVSQQVNHQINQDLLNMPLNYEVITTEWKNILTKITQPTQKSNEENFGKN